MKYFICHKNHTQIQTLLNLVQSNPMDTLKQSAFLQIINYDYLSQSSRGTESLFLHDPTATLGEEHLVITIYQELHLHPIHHPCLYYRQFMNRILEAFVLKKLAS